MSIFVDTGVFFAYYSQRDRYHWDAVAILAHAVEGKWGQAVTSSFVLSEALTLLRAKLPRTSVEHFLDAIRAPSMPPILYLDAAGFEQALTVFQQEMDRSGLSFTDASTLYLLRDHQIAALATFDMRTFRSAAVELLGAGYWAGLQASEQARLRRLLPDRA